MASQNKRNGFGTWLVVFLIVLVVVLGLWYWYRHTRDVRRHERQERARAEQPQPATAPEVPSVDTSAFGQVQERMRDPASTTSPNPEITVNPTGGPIRYTGYDFTKAPGFEYPRPVPGQQIVRYTGYTLSYSEADEQAAWVAYQLTKSEVRGKVERTDNFREDDQIKTGSAAASDYRNSGYDRGHMAPAGDMKWSKKAMSETFYYSNMSPQAPAFNRGIWNELEQKVRNWAEKEGDLYIVTGPVLEPGLKKIGTNGVSVPRFYYKVVLDARGPELKAIAFLLPNRGSQKELSSFVVSIDSVEQRTGLDFFPQLPDDLEVALESSTSLQGWF
ncbi:endonuclease G [Catalinimonas alkaloidigena]|uniref:Endonuclease n=1 Tax=Catalinimonas alkaloidigena TaxID=1075417 RepID=A0A1G9K8Q1_9BACT|nr:DNA/RNA non-specific endonuclease [Catalinimonas alkaloidigena]SDL45653.1 endonuclease G [Catalinimonas alkaloidigena]